MSRQLRTDRLLLRPRAKADMNDCLAMDRDTEVTKYVKGPWHDPGEHRAFLEARMRQTYADPFGYWAITNIENPNLFLGWVMVSPSHDFAKAEIGWRLTRKSWGRGYATEAVGRVIRHTFTVHPNIALTASIHPRNIRSLKVAEKLRMKLSHETQSDSAADLLFVLAQDCASQTKR